MDPRLEIEGLTRRFGAREVVSEVSLTSRRGR
jgi:ABC-type histidine transport system ATPase subunit